MLTVKKDIGLIYALEVTKNGNDKPAYNYGTSNFNDFKNCLKYLKHYIDNDYSITITIGEEKRTYPLTSDFEIIDFSNAD